jgi:tetratricopeptide (TPR) repeat protein
LLGVVGAILEGELLRADDDLEGAIAVFEAGVEIEDGLRYDEPEPLGFSIRHWLGDALWEAERHDEAVEVFRAELIDHPNNGWSLFGLERSLRALDRDQEAGGVRARFREAWARSDTYIRSPIF